MNIVTSRRKRWIVFALAIASFAIQPSAAHAYIGPGAGLTLVGAAVGFVVAIFSAIGVLLLWPIRMLIAWLKKVTAKTPSVQAADGASEPLTRDARLPSQQ